MAAARKLRVSIQTKVLITVVAVLVLLPVVTVWIVDRHITAHMQDDAKQALATAEAVFQQSLEIRSRNALDRYKRLANEPRFKAVAQLNDAKTMSALLRDLIDEAGEDADVMAFSSARGEPVASIRRESSVPLEAFLELCRTPAQTVLKEGEPWTDRVGAGGRVLDAVAVPVWIGSDGPLIGALIVGIRVTATTAHELRTLTGAEIILMANGSVAASTLPPRQVDSIEWLQQRTGAQGLRNGPESLMVNGEHFLAVSAWATRPNGERAFQYALLSSYERRWQAASETRRTLIWWSAAIIAMSTGFVWILVRQITRPLRELRDSAEAVGRGDFSRRITRFSNDECGDLAVAFNQMTANLRGSREELEKTVETLKTTQAQLIQSEKLSAVGEFVAGVAHELNNPLTSVLGYSDLLRLETREPTAREFTDRIVKSAQRCQKIVQSLLSFARQHAPERKLVQVNDLLQDLLEIMAYDLRTSNVAVVTELAPVLPPMLGDSHQLQQVFVNIVNNARQAVQAFRRDGRIVLRTGVVNHRIRVEFEDNGPGIRPEHLKRIFDPFFTTKPVGKGTGLGLSLSYGIIQEHGGKIEVTSEVGHGAKFTIDLPISSPAEITALAAKASTQNPWGAVKPRSVLVVDDESWILDLARELLKRDGHTVETATSGEKGLELIRSREFEVVLCDWKMPGLSGAEFYEQLTLTKPEVVKRVLFMTGDVMNESFQAFIRRHQRECLPKPFSIDDFRRAVARAIPTADTNE